MEVTDLSSSKFKLKNENYNFSTKFTYRETTKYTDNQYLILIHMSLKSNVSFTKIKLTVARTSIAKNIILEFTNININAVLYRIVKNLSINVWLIDVRRKRKEILDAFELLRVSWTERKSNNKILEKSESKIFVRSPEKYAENLIFRTSDEYNLWRKCNAAGARKKGKRRL